ncbi:MAG: glycosyltransferase [Pseudonocardiaceae bacterium]|nr:glycosyltransferase [Pseudonocardiaceae bacterium]
MIRNRRISIITPVYAPRAEYLGETYKSLEAQTLPPGWEWEWLIQQDGPEGGDLDGHVPADERISLRVSSRWGGQALARNLALARASGSLVKVLDADDVLTDGALRRDIAMLDAAPDIAYTISRVVNYHPDGTTTRFPENPDPGPIPIGALLPYWQHHDEPQVHPASLCVRHEILVALGGWMAVTTSEDTGVLLALNAVSSGYFIGEPGLLYRVWPGQTTTTRASDDERAAVLRLIALRAQELLNGTTTAQAQRDGHELDTARTSTGPEV